MQQVERDRPTIFLLFGKILMEKAFRSCQSVAETNEKGVAYSRAGKPSQDFGNVPVLRLLKSMEMVVCLFMPGEDLYYCFSLLIAGHQKFRVQVSLRISTV